MSEFPPGEFRYAPSQHVPFRDVEAIRRCRAIRREEIEKHPNPDLKIRVVKDADVPFINLTDFVTRVKQSAEEGQKLVMILPNPVPLYRQGARGINGLKLSGKHVHV